MSLRETNSKVTGCVLNSKGSIIAKDRYSLCHEAHNGAGAH
jgi:hypothetical protein